MKVFAWFQSAYREMVRGIRQGIREATCRENGSDGPSNEGEQGSESRVPRVPISPQLAGMAANKLPANSDD